MRSQESIIRSQRSCGRFFLFLVALSVALAGINLYNGSWRTALKLVPGMVLLSGIAWWAISTPKTQGSDEDDGPGVSEAGKPVPVVPNPTHHLVAAKDLPPSDKTHLFPAD